MMKELCKRATVKPLYFHVFGTTFRVFLMILEGIHETDSETSWPPEAVHYRELLALN
jgi:hypothetical protein